MLLIFFIMIIIKRMSNNLFGNNRFQAQISLLNEEIRVHKKASDDKDLKVNLFKARIDELNKQLIELRQQIIPKLQPQIQLETPQIHIKTIDCNCKEKIDDLQKTISCLEEGKNESFEIIKQLNLKISEFVYQYQDVKKENSHLKEHNDRHSHDISLHIKTIENNKNQFINNLHQFKQENKCLHSKISELQETINELENQLMITNDNLYNINEKYKKLQNTLNPIRKR